MKIFVTRIIPSGAVATLQEAGITVDQWQEKRNIGHQELIDICKKYDGLISVGQDLIDRSFLQSCRHLKVIAQMAVGFDNIDVEEATRLGIPIGNTPGVLSKATADTAFLLMMAVSRKAMYMNHKIMRGEWGFYEPTADLGIELHGKTLGIFGLGKIGLEMARLCQGAYGMKIIYCNRNHNPEAENATGARIVNFEELLAFSDVLSVHTALTAQTKGIFNRQAFDQMKKTAIFINTARGSIHNEEDLIEAMRQGSIWGCGLDVTNPEPMQPDNPLLDMPTAVILPHIGSATQQTRAAMAAIAAENILACRKGEPLPYPVNPELYKP